MARANESSGRPSHARKWVIALAIVVAIILAVIFVLPALIDVNNYRGRIQAELQSRLGRPVALGEMHLSIVPLAFRADNVVIGEDANFRTGRPFANAQQLQVEAKLWPLLHGNVEIDSLKLTRPDVELVRNTQGVWNFASLGQPPQAAPAPQAKQPPAQAPAPQQPAPPQPQPQRKLTLSNLAITDGLVAITDQQKRQPRTVYDHIDLSAQDFAPDKAFPLTVTAHLPGQGTQQVKLDGTIGPVNNSDIAATPFDGALDMDQASISAVQKFLNVPALAGTEATLSGSVKLKSEGGAMRSNGTLKLADVKIHNVALGYPVAMEYDVADNLNTDELQIGKGDLKLGKTPVSIAGTVNMHGTPSQLNLRVKAGNIGIQEIARLASAFGVAFNPGAEIAGTLNADISATGAANKPALNGTINASDLVITGKQLKQPVQVSQVQLAMTPQQIRSNPFQAKTGGTTVAAQFALSNYTAPHSTIDATLRTVNAQLGELLDIANAYGVSGVDGMQGNGAVSLDVHAVGPTSDANAMTFSGTGALRNATLKMPSLGRPLAVHNADVQFTRNGAALNNFSGTLGSTNATGQLSLANFSAPVVRFTLNADKVIASEWEQMFAAQPAPAQPKTGRLQLVTPAYAATPAEPSLFNKMTGGGVITAATVIYNALTLNNVHSNVTLNRGIVQLAPVTAQVYGGQQTGSIVLDMRTTPATYTVNTQLQKVDANQLLSSISSLKQTLYGMLAANAKGSFTSTAGSDVAKTLNGTVNLDLTNGRLANVDMLYQLASIGRFLSYGKPMQPYTSVAKLLGTFNIANGVASTNNFQADLGLGKVAGDGTINLVNDTLDMHLTAVLSKAFSGTVGGTGIGGMLQTALANNNGELVIPVIVSGSFQHPQFTPDAQKLAQMRLQNLLPTAGNPAAATAGILGSILNRQGGQAPNVGGIVGTILGQPQQQPPVPQQQQAPPAGQSQQNPANPAQGQAPPPQQQQPGNVFSNILNQVLQNQQQKKQPPAPPPPQQQQQNPPPPPPQQPR